MSDANISPDNNEKDPIIYRVKKFFFSPFFTILAVILVVFSGYTFYTKTYFPYEFWIFLAAAIYFILVLIQRNRYFFSNRYCIYEPSHIKDHRKEMSIIFFLCIVSFIFLSNNQHILWFVVTISISFSIALVIRCYPKEFDPIHQSLKKITIIEIASIIISLGSLLVGYMQLTSSPTQEDIDKLSSSIEKMQIEFRQNAMSNIPEYLIQNEDALKARKLQKKLYANTITLSNIDFEYDFDFQDYDIKGNWDGKKFNQKQNRLLNSYINSQLLLKEVEGYIEYKKRIDYLLIDSFVLLKTIINAYEGTVDLDYFDLDRLDRIFSKIQKEQEKYKDHDKLLLQEIKRITQKKLPIEITKKQARIKKHMQEGYDLLAEDHYNFKSHTLKMYEYYNAVFETMDKSLTSIQMKHTYEDD